MKIASSTPRRMVGTESRRSRPSAPPHSSATVLLDDEKLLDLVNHTRSRKDQCRAGVMSNRSSNKSNSKKNHHQMIVSGSRSASVSPVPELAIAKGGVAVPFPWKIHAMLDATEQEGLQHIVSWQPHGRSFTVHSPDLFVRHVLPRFFSQSKYASFQRQLNLYGFSRFSHGRDKGAYYHVLFVKQHPDLVRGMVRRKIKGTKVRTCALKNTEPDFYHAVWKNPLYRGEPEETEEEASETAVTKQEDAIITTTYPFFPPPSSPTVSAPRRVSNTSFMMAPETSMGLQHKALVAPKPLQAPSLPTEPQPQPCAAPAVSNPWANVYDQCTAAIISLKSSPHRVAVVNHHHDSTTDCGDVGYDPIDVIQDAADVKDEDACLFDDTLFHFLDDDTSLATAV